MVGRGRDHHGLRALAARRGAGAGDPEAGGVFQPPGPGLRPGPRWTLPRECRARCDWHTPQAGLVGSTQQGPGREGDGSSAPVSAPTDRPGRSGSARRSQGLSPPQRATPPGSDACWCRGLRSRHGVGRWEPDHRQPPAVPRWCRSSPLWQGARRPLALGLVRSRPRTLRLGLARDREWPYCAIHHQAGWHGDGPVDQPFDHRGSRGPVLGHPRHAVRRDLRLRATSQEVAVTGRHGTGQPTTFLVIRQSGCSMAFDAGCVGESCAN